MLRFESPQPIPQMLKPKPQTLNTKPHHAVSGSRLLETNSSVRPEDLASMNTSEAPEARIGGVGRGKDRLMQCLLSHLKAMLATI